MFMLFRHVPSGAFPSAEISPSVHLALPSVKILPPPARLFPVSEAALACASALRPWTIPCAPCFAFPCSCFSKQILARRFPSVKVPLPAARCFPLYGDFPVGPSGAFLLRRFPRRSPGFSRVGRLHRPALLRCAPGRYSARPALPSMFMLFRHVPSGAFPSAEISRRFIWRFPLYEDSLAARPVLSCVGSCTGLRFCVAPPDDTLCALLRLSMFMLLKQILARRFPFCGISPSVHLALPLCEDSPAARPAFPVSEATPACASALRPWTIPCAPRFAFHVHTSQANSRPLFPPLRRFPVGPSGASLLRRFPRRFIWRFPSVKILPPPAPRFPVSEAAPACASALRPGRYSVRPASPFHVHASQANSRPALSLLRRFSRRFIWRFPSVKISSPHAPLFPVSEAAPACASALRPWTIPCAPRFCLPCPYFSSKFPSK